MVYKYCEACYFVSVTIQLVRLSYPSFSPNKFSVRSSRTKIQEVSYFPLKFKYIWAPHVPLIKDVTSKSNETRQANPFINKSSRTCFGSERVNQQYRFKFLKPNWVCVFLCIADMKAVVSVLLIILVMVLPAKGQLKAGFYSSSCPKAEATVRSTVESYYNKDPTIAAGLLRLHFHDCFVQVFDLVFFFVLSYCCSRLT